MDTVIESVVETLVVPLANTVPVLASSGILLLVFAALWVAFGVALARDRARLDGAWRWLRSLPLVVQAIAWLLFLPVVAGLLVWRAGWPLAGRLATIGAIAGWNLLVFLPQPM
jgi:hypothetical protein